MKREDELKIIEYRKAGIGYKKIATLLGISKNTVASFCKRNDMNKETAKLIKYCKMCGTPFFLNKKHTNQIFCSHACKYSWWNAYKKSLKGGNDNE